MVPPGNWPCCHAKGLTAARGHPHPQAGSTGQHGVPAQSPHGDGELPAQGPRGRHPPSWSWLSAVGRAGHGAAASCPRPVPAGLSRRTCCTWARSRPPSCTTASWSRRPATSSRSSWAASPWSASRSAWRPPSASSWCSSRPPPAAPWSTTSACTASATPRTSSRCQGRRAGRRWGGGRLQLLWPCLAADSTPVPQGRGGLEALGQAGFGAGC